MWPGVNGKGQVIISSALSPRQVHQWKLTQGKSFTEQKATATSGREAEKECGFYKEAIGNVLYMYAVTLKLLGFWWEEMIFGKHKEFSQIGMFIGERDR